MRDTYALKWITFRRIRLFAILTPIAFLTAPLLLSKVIWLLFRSLVPLDALEIALMPVIAFFVWRYFTFQCPRCSEPFGRFREECQNCFLPKWASTDTSDGSEDKGTSTMHGPQL